MRLCSVVLHHRRYLDVLSDFLHTLCQEYPGLDLPSRMGADAITADVMGALPHYGYACTFCQATRAVPASSCPTGPTTIKPALPTLLDHIDGGSRRGGLGAHAGRG